MKFKKYDHKTIEDKWQKYWDKTKLYSPDLLKANQKFYNLWMFPYPSAEGVHVGTIFSSTGSDVYGHFMRMKGYKVFQPIGFDSFGIHSENYALKIGENPKVTLKRTLPHFREQFKMIGHAYDWTRSVTTSDPDYYRWTQWLFVKIFKAGLAYKKRSNVNWCPSCKTVLADEQVVTPAQSGKEVKDPSGKTLPAVEGMKVCERCGTLIERKELEQWMFRITRFADRLIENLKKINWPEKVKTGQKNWIGKKTGAFLTFRIWDTDLKIEVFTTRPDTIYGATFLVVSPGYFTENLYKYVNFDKRQSINVYIEKINEGSNVEFQIKKGSEKTGIETGLFAINPVNNKKIPIFLSDYVLDEYGTGAIMGVPAHDERDFDFAKKFGIEIIEVIDGGKVGVEAYLGSGKIVNSGDWNGLIYPHNYITILNDIVRKGWGYEGTQYHLRDWLISRQRYWGTPIPMIYCTECALKRRSWFTENKSKEVLYKDQTDWEHFGWWPVDEKNLPVELPDISDYKPKGEGKGPLNDHPEFYKVKCPYCGNNAKRETDVSDTFLDSSWYFLRYPSVGVKSREDKSVKEDKVADEKPWDREITKKWLPVDLYFGGAEHTVLHLMYARFVTMALHDMGYLGFEEPFPWFYAHGLMIRNGSKMSKSRGNVVNPDEYIKKFGADTLRLYLMFMGPMDGYPDFRDEGIEGMHRFIEKLWKLFNDCRNGIPESIQLDIKMHQTIKKVTEDFEKFKYNTAISAIMEYVNEIKSQRELNRDNKSGNLIYMENLVLLIAPFAPHLAEEIWQMMTEKWGMRIKKLESVHLQPWPLYDKMLTIEKRLTIPVQVNGKLRGTIEIEREKEKDKEYVLNISKNNNKIQKWLSGKKISNEIYVEGRLVNLVIKE